MKIDGCFVQLTKTDNSRPESGWTTVVADFQRLKVKHLIIQRAEFVEPTGTTNYENAIKNIAAAVNKANASADLTKVPKIDLIVGLYMPNNNEWGYNTYKTDPDFATHIDGWAKRNMQLAKSIWLNPEASKCVEGWYLPMEPWNFDTTTMQPTGPAFYAAVQKHIADSVTGLKPYGNKPVSMSVFANPWQYMPYVGETVTEGLYAGTILKSTGLTNLLIQDSYGAKMLGEPLPGRNPTATTPAQAMQNELKLIKAFQKAASVNGIKSWLVVEAFQARATDPARTRDDPTADSPFEPAPTARYKQQLADMEQMKNELDGAVIFEYLYYLDPAKSKELNDATLGWQLAK